MSDRKTQIKMKTWFFIKGEVAEGALLLKPAAVARLLLMDRSLTEALTVVFDLWNHGKEKFASDLGVELKKQSSEEIERAVQQVLANPVISRLENQKGESLIWDFKEWLEGII